MPIEAVEMIEALRQGGIAVWDLFIEIPLLWLLPIASLWVGTRE